MKFLLSGLFFKVWGKPLRIETFRMFLCPHLQTPPHSSQFFFSQTESLLLKSPKYVTIFSSFPGSAFFSAFELLLHSIPQSMFHSTLLAWDINRFCQNKSRGGLCGQISLGSNTKFKNDVVFFFLMVGLFRTFIWQYPLWISRGSHSCRFPTRCDYGLFCRSLRVGCVSLVHCLAHSEHSNIIEWTYRNIFIQAFILLTFSGAPFL